MSIIPLARTDATHAPDADLVAPAPRPDDPASRSHGVEAPYPDLLRRVASREPIAPADEADLSRLLAAGDPTALTAVTRWLWEPLAA